MDPTITPVDRYPAVLVTNASGNQQPAGVVQLKLQTLKDEYGYWLDTGIFSISARSGA